MCDLGHRDSGDPPGRPLEGAAAKGDRQPLRPLRSAFRVRLLGLVLGVFRGSLKGCEAPRSTRREEGRR